MPGWPSEELAEAPHVGRGRLLPLGDNRDHVNEGFGLFGHSMDLIRREPAHVVFAIGEQYDQRTTPRDRQLQASVKGIPERGVAAWAEVVEPALHGRAITSLRNDDL